MDDGYKSKCPKCNAPIEQVKRVYHEIGKCPNNNSGSEHVEWTCICGHKWMSYPR